MTVDSSTGSASDGAEPEPKAAGRMRRFFRWWMSRWWFTLSVVAVTQLLVFGYLAVRGNLDLARVFGSLYVLGIIGVSASVPRAVSWMARRGEENDIAGSDIYVRMRPLDQSDTYDDRTLEAAATRLADEQARLADQIGRTERTAALIPGVIALVGGFALTRLQPDISGFPAFFATAALGATIGTVADAAMAIFRFRVVEDAVDKALARLSLPYTEYKRGEVAALFRDVRTLRFALIGKQRLTAESAVGAAIVVAFLGAGALAGAFRWGGP